MSLLFSDDLCSAFTAAVVRSFQQQTQSGYLGRTAIQKLLYFSIAVGVPAPCSFEIYNFGPYSDDITKSVNRLLADEAIEDVSTNPSKYSSYRLGPNADDFSPAIKDFVQRYIDTIDMVVGTLGKSSPATLELVATLHFVNAKLKGLRGNRPSKADVETEFHVIKGSKFSPSEIDSWYGWLEGAGLLQ